MEPPPYTNQMKPGYDTSNQQPYYPQQQQPYYPQQPPYANQPNFQQQQQQQQQQQPQHSVTVINAGQPQIVYAAQRTYQSFCGHIALACCVFWCCNWVFGLISFILAMIASDRASTGHDGEARQLGQASIGVSIAGIVITIVVVAIIVGVTLSSPPASSISSQCYCRATEYGSFAYRSCYLCYKY